MKARIKDIKICSNSYLFLIIICISFINIISFNYFKVYNLLSNDYLVLITNEGIIKYEPSTQTQTLLVESLSNIITTSEDEKLISFTQFSLDEGGYVFCRISEYIYVFDKNLDTYYNNFEISEIQNCYCILKPYTNSNSDITLIISSVNDEFKINILKYKINIGQTINLSTLINDATKEVKNPDGEITQIMNKAFSCELIINSTNKLLICFVVGLSGYISALKFDPENLSFLDYSTSFKEMGSLNFIQSNLSYDNKNSLICFIGSTGYLSCLLYDNINDKFSNINQVINNCYTGSMDIKCINEKQECSIYFSASNTMSFISFDKNFNIKDKDINNNNCYISSSVMDSNCYSVVSSHFSYFKNEEKYIILRTCNLGNNYILNELDISLTCNKNIEIVGLDCNNCNNNDPTTIPSTIPSTIPITIITTIHSTIPTIKLTTNLLQF